MRINTRASATAKLPRTFEGAVAKRITPEQELRRSVMANMLFEGTFYESGVSIAERIASLIPKVKPETVARIAREARTEFKLRHVPLLLVREMARGTAEARRLVADTLFDIIQRPDELTEFVAIYWKDKRQSLSAQVKKGLARAFGKFNEYSLAKYNRDGAVKLRDVLFLSHAKPKDKEQEALFKKVVDNQLQTPDTWEVALSGGADKKEAFTRLISERKLGALAMLRNLRNMQTAGVAEDVIRTGLLTMNVERVLPFRFISAAKYAPKFEPELEQAMFKCLEGQQKLAGKTALLVDTSGSMEGQISGKSDLSRFEAAAALAILLREICEQVVVWDFSNTPVLIPARRGFALRDAMNAAAEWSGTYTENAKKAADREGYDRIIILTDEQSHQSLSNPNGKGYVINVAAYKNGVGYGAWNHIDGWSEAVIDYIQQYETLEQ
jgi:60 kDa SS-A/Ro ribonucleoprotein